MAEVRLAALLAETQVQLAGAYRLEVDASLRSLEGELGAYDVASVASQELGGEFRSMVSLYRSVRAVDAAAQRRRRRSEIADRLSLIYYRLRSIHGGLAARYAVSGETGERPDTSPLGIAIGLYDVSKVVAQQTHLESGSYDALLPWFTRWMLEIWEDLGVRLPDYVAFYSRRDPRDARRAIARMLSLEEDGNPRLFAFQEGGSDDPRALIIRLRDYAASERDLVDAVRTVQQAGHRARLALVSLFAHRERYVELLGADTLASREATLREALEWPFPVGPTPIFDLNAEQQVLDDLLASLSDGPVKPSTALRAKVEAALHQACQVEQSFRDHRQEYRERGLAHRRFGWYVWELLRLVDQATPRGGLGARRRGPPS